MHRRSGAAVCALLAAGLLACSDPNAHAARTPAEHALPTLQLQAETLPDDYQTVGAIISDERVEISSRIPAYVRAIEVREGERISRGQSLVQLDARDQEAAVQQALAQRATREAAFRDAQRTLNDTMTLLKRGLVSDAVRRRAQLEWDTAKQALRTQEAMVDASQAQLRYTGIVSPVDGVVTASSARAGDLVTPGRTLLVVESDTALLFETAVAESQVRHIAVGDAAQVHIDAPDRDYAATVLRVVPSGDPVTRRFTVKLRLDDVSDLSPGMFGRSSFRVGQTSGLRVPDAALARRGGLDGVFVVGEGEQLAFRWVRTGRSLDGHTEITAGLNPGETVLAQVSSAVRDGDRVTRSQP